jgi:hypothetical protein
MPCKFPFYAHCSHRNPMLVTPNIPVGHCPLCLPPKPPHPAGLPWSSILRSATNKPTDNIDYTEIKQLIKHYTTQKPPVSSPDQHTDFENEVFEVFLDQLQRIDLFVKSKAGEIDRRIGGLQLPFAAKLARSAELVAGRPSKLLASLSLDLQARQLASHNSR